LFRGNESDTFLPSFLPSFLLVAAWLVTIGLRRIAARFGLLRHIWHPAIFVFAVYMIVLSTIVLTIGAD
jgi:hypothetical protein